MITQTYDLNLIPGGVPVHVRASQYDAGTRTVVFRLFSGSLVFTPASGTEARVEGTRADGVAFTASAVIDGSTVSFTVTSAMTNAAGAHAAEIVLTDAGGNPLGTKNFIIDVEAAAMDESAEPTEEEESLYQEYYKKIRASESAAASSASAAEASAQSAAVSAEETAEKVSNMAALTASGSGDIVTLHNLAGGIPLKELTVHIEPVQAGSGDPSPDNVRPITGWTGAKVARTGKNLFDADGLLNAQGWAKNANGEYYGPISQLNYDRFNARNNCGKSLQKSAYGDNYTLTFDISADSYAHVGFSILNRNGTRRNKQVSDVRSTSVLLVSDCTSDERVDSLWFSYSSDRQITMSEIQLERGSTATDYEPYAGRTYDISFGSAGTVYGGTLDVTTGVLTVDRKALVGGDFNWRRTKIWGSDKTFSTNINTVSDMDTDASVNIHGNVLSSAYYFAQNFGGIDERRLVFAGEGTAFTLRTDTREICVSDPRFADDAATEGQNSAGVKAMLQDVQFSYPLATPITYQLTPQEVTTLLGVNNIWADAGPVDVTYAIDVSAMQARINELSAAMDGAYTGVDLTVRFASEIANYSSVWAWIQARAKAKNYADLHVGDYIPIKTTNNITLNAQIAGLGNYTGYGDSAVGGHIDFICKELWPTRHVMNKVNFNNGISDASPYPWLASGLYHYLNSLSGTVPNAAAVGGGDGEAVDYTADGVYYYLPAALKAVIIQKRLLLPKRYSASGLLNADNGWGWTDAGRLWIPSEIEVYGTAMWGNTGYGAGGFQQYPLFAHNMNRVKYRSGSRDHWWLLSAYSGSSTLFAHVNSNGNAHYYYASATHIAAPVCFRVG